MEKLLAQLEAKLIRQERVYNDTKKQIAELKKILAKQ